MEIMSMHIDGRPATHHQRTYSKWYIVVIGSEEAFEGKPFFRRYHHDELVYYKQASKTGRIRVGRMDRVLFEKMMVPIFRRTGSQMNREEIA